MFHSLRDTYLFMREFDACNILSINVRSLKVNNCTGASSLLLYKGEILKANFIELRSLCAPLQHCSDLHPSPRGRDASNDTARVASARGAFGELLYLR